MEHTTQTRSASDDLDYVEESVPRWLRRSLTAVVVLSVYGLLSFSGHVPTVAELVTPNEGVQLPAGADAPGAPGVDIPTAELPDALVPDMPAPVSGGAPIGM